MLSCRLCFSKSENENNIINIAHNTDLLIKIRNCVSIDVNEHEELSTFVCSLCINKVNDWYEFKEMCLKNDDILKMSISPCSNEQSDEDGDKNCSSSDSWKVSDYEDSIDDDEFTSEVQCNESIERGQFTYKCDICDEEFPYYFDYLDHQPVHDGESVFKCDKCCSLFSTRKDLVEHDQQHKRPCPKCGKLILKSSIRLHLVQHTDRYMCPKCSHRFSSHATLQQHIVTVHTNIKNHICETCGKRFSSKTSMNVHLKTHSDERMYSCKLCNYAGRTSSAIYIHMSTHANEVHSCSECSKSFKSSRNLSDHMRRVHSKEKKHQCSYCNKKFVDKYMLMVHVRSHTGVRPFKCNLCEKAFIRSDSLKEHMGIHGVRTLYDCSTCTKKFTSKRGAARHQCAFVP